MKHTRQQIIDMSNRSHSHAEALATLYQMIREEIEQDRKITRRKIRASVDMTTHEHKLYGPMNDVYAIAESVFAAAGWTIVDDDPEPVQGWQPIETAPKDGRHIFVKRRSFCPVAAYHGSTGTVWRHSDSGSPITLTPSHWMPIPPLPENDK